MQPGRVADNVTRLEVSHGDHTHRFDMAGRSAPVPPVLKLRCSACKRLIREVSINHDGRVFVLGGVSPEGRPGELAEGGGRTQGITETVNGKSRTILRAADCFDASPGGWDSSRRPSHYRFVCRHKKDGASTLERPVTADSLFDRYLEAVCQRLSSIVLD